MSWVQVALLSLYALGMAGGQMLFKLASRTQEGVHSGVISRVAALLQDPFFLLAILVYFSLSFMWAWILSFTPLSRAYPFTVLAVVATPILGAVFFAEPLTIRFAVGMAAVIAGLLLVMG